MSEYVMCVYYVYVIGFHHLEDTGTSEYVMCVCVKGFYSLQGTGMCVCVC